MSARRGQSAASVDRHDRMPALTVYFDGACPLCRREIGFFRRRRSDVEIDWVDVSASQSASLGPDLSRPLAMARFHVRLANGDLVSGARGFGELWAVTPGFRWLGTLARSTVAQAPLELAYRGFLLWRPFAQRIAARVLREPKERQARSGTCSDR